MAEFITTRGVVLLDDEDVPKLAGKTVYTVGGKNGCRYGVIFLNGKTLRIHRVVLSPPAGMHVDHINGNGLDNRKQNLRLCSPTENNRNMRKSEHRICSSKFKGVHVFKGRFTSRISIGGKSKWVGSFGDEIVAAKAYDETARRYHGAFARLNFPRPGEQPALLKLPHAAPLVQKDR